MKFFRSHGFVSKVVCLLAWGQGLLFKKNKAPLELADLAAWFFCILAIMFQMPPNMKENSILTKCCIMTCNLLNDFSLKQESQDQLYLCHKQGYIFPASHMLVTLLSRYPHISFHALNSLKSIIFTQ